MPYALRPAPAVLESLRALTGIAHLLASTDRSQRAAQLLVAVLHHPAGTGATRVRAERLLSELASRLQPETIPLLEARATAVDLDQLMASLSEEV